MTTDNSGLAGPRTAYEIAVAQAKAAGRCEQCIAYGVRPGLLCGTCGDGLMPARASAADQEPGGGTAADAGRQELR